ncbi:GDSL-type esterase/lipase family protein [Streptomyces sp. NBC_00847]|uniref:GDSL-type esterase/lipase family protein n=1 Tax=Streptomyces sp. NBC_00847 TaxID=2975850 RepID=UPI00225E2DEF|nr:GDSL-type esterase/lipase family protein [Streptomyces sp. NBC_00847]MCX4885583.1 GDSL-type esterase/lipase family protein [Streptomyces sp. NBC_00847]
MRSVLDLALDCVTGALVKSAEATGVTLHRAPAAGRTQLDSQAYEFNSSVPSGVRLEMLTDATEIELDARLAQVLLQGASPTGSVFDLVVEGELRDPVVATEQTLILVEPATFALHRKPADPATVRFHLGPAPQERRVEIWLPAARSFQLVDVRVPEGASVRPAPASGPLWVHHGSSISQCAEADRPTGTWPAIVARTAGRSLLNLALGGECHLDPFMARTIRDLPAEGISLELGINVLIGDTMRERVFVPALHGFLDTIRDGHPDTAIVVITPITCPAAETRPGPTLVCDDGTVCTVDRPAELANGALTLTRIRELLNQHVEQRRKDGDDRLHLIDGTALFGPEDVANLPDGLHPNAAGYADMAERFLPLAFGDTGVLR